LTNILAIETSTDNCSVAVSNGEKIYNFHESLPKQHTEKLFEIIHDILEEGELSFKDLDAVAVGIGPGSYTGIRLSCAVSQGIAYANGLKGLAIPSLELLALETHKKTSSELVVSIIEASSDKIYLGESSFSEGNIESKFSLLYKDLFSVKNYPSSTSFVGQGCGHFLDIENELLEEFPKASSLIEITRMRKKFDALQDPETFLPIYLTDEDNWQKLK
jgi:tRNA threonylcarbamoyladenosine biosynthesis protein TsaB